MIIRQVLRHYRDDSETLSFFYVLACLTSFQYLSIPCNAFIACYSYVTIYLIGINLGLNVNINYFI